MVLMPKFRLSRTLGVGFEPVNEAMAVNFHKKFARVLRNARSNAAVPIRWVVSRGWQIGKNIGKEGVKAERTMCGFCPSSKAFFGGTLVKGEKIERGGSHQTTTMVMSFTDAEKMQ